MGKTVRQVSQELGISKPAVTQRMNTIKSFRSNYTHKVGNHLEINEKGINLLTNYGTEDHRTKVTNDKEKGNKDNKSNKNSKQVDTIYLMKQIEIKDKQIDNLQKSLDKQQILLDQQQQLQLTIVSENRKLKERIQKLSGLIETSKPVNKQQINDKNNNLSNVYRSSDNKNTNDKHTQKRVVNTDHKKVNKSWWHFW
ncbi:DUF536 domain-containing protein [Lentilactobacillus hilgardii]|uniref:DUF536 domain-containing protein n=1 Tax=Lentilactobacillus hilgardii TaxID=1588 RepID=UPI00390C4230